MFTDNKKSCKEIKDLLDAYYDKELQLAEAQVVEEHLATCSSCMQELQSIAYLVNQIKDLPALKPGTDIISVLDFSKAAHKGLFKPGILNSSAWLILATAAVIALLFVSTSFLSTNTVPEAAVKSHQGHFLADNNKQQQIVKTSLAYLPKLSINKKMAKAKTMRELPQETLLLSDNSNENFIVTKSGVDSSSENILMENGSSNNESGYIEIAAMGDNNEGTSAGALDIATDEDGLYDIRL